MESGADGEKMPERRKFLLSMAKSLGAATVGGLTWTGYLEGKKAYSSILRPPGAVAEEDFLARCTKCGICVEACPYQALILASPGDERPVGTPYFQMRENPCRMCRDIPCTAACPTGALDRTLVSDPDGQGVMRLNINKTQIGLAVIDRETCIAYWGIQCDVCYRACPVLDKALTVEYVRNERTGRHAMLAPVIHSSHCTGCGMCERACVTKKAAVFILPRAMAMGESSNRYIKGWDRADEERMNEAPEETETATPRSEKSPMDYLNKGGL
ncbi:MAG: ferredoxin-type protein NapG [Thermodesulfovibrio sp.]|nr:ferredoxin-type protein NapG [Thermodesulfovibrio sp.]